MDRVARWAMRVIVPVIGLMLLVPASPATAGDCHLCNEFDDCVADVLGSGCYCIIKFINGNKICREADWCFLGCEGPPGGAPQMSQYAVSPNALQGFYRDEPILAMLLLGSAIVPEEPPRRWALKIDDYGGGTMTMADDAHYAHHGSFQVRPNGALRFHFFVERDLGSEAGVESSKYVGELTDGGRVINYKKIVAGLSPEDSSSASRSWVYEEPAQR